MFPDAGGPMYRRPPPGPPGPLLPHPRSFLAGPPPGPPHSTDIAGELHAE